MVAAVAGAHSRFEVGRGARRDCVHPFEDTVPIIRVEVRDERLAPDQFRVVAEQACDRTVDRTDMPVTRNQCDHPLHVVHDGPEHVDITLVEVELVTISRVAGDDDDEVFAVLGLLHGSTQLEVDPCSATVAYPNPEQLAIVLVGHRFHRCSDQIEIIGMDEGEYRFSDHRNRIPTKNFSRSLVRIAQHP